MTKTTMRYLAALGIVLAAAACNSDELFHNTTEDPVNPLFARYVSMGNSITAGFQSAGINDSTQRLAYPVLLARQMHTPFYQPLLNKPGCPPPFTNVFTQARLAGGTSTSCFLRESQTPPPPFINDVAVPGATASSPTNNLAPGSNSNQLTAFFLGGLTQIGMMRKVQPTFITVWIGNNDVLGAATDQTHPGDSLEVTDTNTFRAEYKAMLDSIDAIGSVKGGVLIGVADVTQIPYASLGAVYFQLKATVLAALPSFQVDTSCAPTVLGGSGDSTLVPFFYGLGLIGAAKANPAGGPFVLNCDGDNLSITKPEFKKLHNSVVAYNAYISAQAAARGYAFFDPNVALAQLKADTTQVAFFPHAPPDPRATTAPFGTAFSFDGVHPSAATHKLVANTLIGVINAKYGTSLKTIP
ncbi:MAG TPA: SGNH/GDSL hydrolase family protein [Gemmatimonadales bacterium]|nr:SGNH/GDSL hydrolase family protein [Gemmatimonadales bacterium]